MGATNPLDEKSRQELVDEARKIGVERPERMTRVELRDEIVRRSVSEERQAEARGLFGVARSMLASVVDRGLHLPDAARVIRGESAFEVPVTSQTPVATVTLAEIYAAQGHKNRALRILEDVLRQEPGHEEALRVQAGLRAGTSSAESGGPEIPSKEELREALTLEAPPVAPQSLDPSAGDISATTDYVPGGFVETIGEEVETGRQPEVEEAPPERKPEAPLISDEGANSTPFISAEVARAPVLVLSQSDGGLALYWELPERALDECSIDRNEGRAVARIVSFSPKGPTPARHEDTIVLAETIPVQAPSGCSAGKLKLERYGAPNAVRAALGWETEDGFLPLTVGRSVQAWQTDEGGREVVARASSALF